MDCLMRQAVHSICMTEPAKNALPGPMLGQVSELLHALRPEASADSEKN